MSFVFSLVKIRLYYAVQTNNFSQRLLIVFSFIAKRTIVRVTNMLKNAQYKKPIFQELISRVLLEIEAKDPVFV